MSGGGACGDAAGLAAQPDVDGVLCRCGGGGSGSGLPAAAALTRVQEAAPRVLHVAGLGSRRAL